jgi:hypothetical protein
MSDQQRTNFGKWSNPTWREGYWACEMGWALHPGATPAYEAGWKYRNDIRLKDLILTPDGWEREQ